MPMTPAIARPYSARQAAINLSASRGAIPAFCGSSPVLISTNNTGERACFEMSDRIGRLVGLQRADQVKLDIAVALDEGRPFALRLLNPVFAENALSGGNHRLDCFGLKRLADGNQRDVGWIAPGKRCCLADAGANAGKAA